MNKKFLAGATIIAIGASSLVAFADNTNTADTNGNQPMLISANPNKGKGMEMRNERANNRQEFRSEYGYFNQFIKGTTTADEKTAIKKILDDSRTSIEAIQKQMQTEMQALTGTGKTAEAMKAIRDKYQPQIVTAMKASFEAIKPYIDSTKIDDFNKFVTERLALLEKNQGLHAGEMNGMKKGEDKGMGMMGKGKDMKDGMKDMKCCNIPESVKKLLDSKLDVIADANKEAVFKTLITKLDTLISNTTDAKKKALFEGVKQYIEQKLTDLGSTSDINNLFQGL